MTDPQTKSKISQLLERLQEESWQLELLISGFAIFLVASGWGSIEDLAVETAVKNIGGDGGLNFQSIFMGIIIASWYFLLINLIFHVFLRGLWISTIGLRYISGDVDFDMLNLAPKFDQFLRKRLGSFDEFIVKVEKICSVVFSFTFIIIFMIISIGLHVVFIIVLIKLLDYSLNPVVDPATYRIISSTVIAFAILTGFLYFIDFASLGWIKRQKFISRFYFPIYRFYSWLTLSFLYRPIYYNLIDDRFGRKVGFLILPYLIISVSLASVETESFLYFPASPSALKISQTFYTDQNLERQPIFKSNIPSKVVPSGFLELFIPYHGSDNEAIESICPDLLADKKTGTRITMFKFTGFSDNKPSTPDSLLHCISQVNQVMIDDSIYNDLSYHFYIHPNREEHGLLALIDIENLERGEHRLVVKKSRLAGKDSLYWIEFSDFPFWKK